MSGDSIQIVDHHAEFNCCLAAWMQASVTGDRIVVVEIEDPDDQNGYEDSEEAFGPWIRRCEGVIITALRGDKGFGYDPLFVPDGHDQTFAELGEEVKNRISHRGRALQKAHEQWGTMLAEDPDDWPED